MKTMHLCLVLTAIAILVAIPSNITASSSRNRTPNPVAVGQTVRINRSLDGQVISHSALNTSNRHAQGSVITVVVEVTNTTNDRAKLEIDDFTLWFHHDNMWHKVGRASEYRIISDNNNNNDSVDAKRDYYLNENETVRLEVTMELHQRRPRDNRIHVDIGQITSTSQLLFDFDDDLRATVTLR